MKPKVYKDESWVLEIYASGRLPVRITGFESASDAADGLLHRVTRCIMYGHAFTVELDKTFCEDCRVYVDSLTPAAAS